MGALDDARSEFAQVRNSLLETQRQIAELNATAARLEQTVRTHAPAVAQGIQQGGVGVGQFGQQAPRIAQGIEQGGAGVGQIGQQAPRIAQGIQQGGAGIRQLGRAAPSLAESARGVASSASAGTRFLRNAAIVVGVVGVVGGGFVLLDYVTRAPTFPHSPRST